MITRIHGRVVKEQHDVARLVPGTSVLFKRETRDGLFLAIFPNLEVFLSEIADVIAFLVGHNRVHQDLTGLHVDNSLIGGLRGS